MRLVFKGRLVFEEIRYFHIFCINRIKNLTVQKLKALCSVDYTKNIRVAMFNMKALILLGGRLKIFMQFIN